MALHRYGCTLPDPHDCANVRAANDALRRHLDRACEERDSLRTRLAAEVALADGLAEALREVTRRGGLPVVPRVTGMPADEEDAAAAQAVTPTDRRSA